MTAGCGGEISAALPGSAVAVTYASGCERDRAQRLAQDRQQLAERGCLLPGWDELTSYEQAMATLEARNWLRAATTAGLVTPCPVHDDAASHGPVNGGTP